MSSSAVRKYIADIRQKLCAPKNKAALGTAGLILIVYLSLGIAGLVVKGPTCGIGSTVLINNWIEIAGICYLVAVGIFIIVLIAIVFDWLWIVLVFSIGTQIGLFVLVVIGIVTLATSTDCSTSSNAVWSMAMAQVITFFISVVIYTIGFVVACNSG